MTVPQDVTAEHCRAYVRLLARRAIPQELRGKVDESDLIQDTLCEAFRKRTSFRGASSKQFLAWLRRILHNKLCDAHRRYRREKRDVRRERSMHLSLEHSSQCLSQRLCSGNATPSENAEQQEAMLRVSQVILELPERQREAVELHYFDAYSFSEVAKSMQLSRNQVAGLIRRALVKLRAATA